MCPKTVISARPLARRGLRCWQRVMVMFRRFVFHLKSPAVSTLIQPRSQIIPQPISVSSQNWMRHVSSRHPTFVQPKAGDHRAKPGRINQWHHHDAQKTGSGENRDLAAHLWQAGQRISPKPFSHVFEPVFCPRDWKNIQTTAMNGNAISRALIIEMVRICAKTKATVGMSTTNPTSGSNVIRGAPFTTFAAAGRGYVNRSITQPLAR